MFEDPRHGRRAPQREAATARGLNGLGWGSRRGAGRYRATRTGSAIRRSLVQGVAAACLLLAELFSAADELVLERRLSRSDEKP
jgi:hypothetical protein